MAVCLPTKNPPAIFWDLRNKSHSTWTQTRRESHCNVPTCVQTRGRIVQPLPWTTAVKDVSSWTATLRVAAIPWRRETAPVTSRRFVFVETCPSAVTKLGRLSASLAWIWKARTSESWSTCPAGEIAKNCACAKMDLIAAQRYTTLSAWIARWVRKRDERDRKHSRLQETSNTWRTNALNQVMTCIIFFSLALKYYRKKSRQIATSAFFRRCQ